jgi:hypothetical protein
MGLRPKPRAGLPPSTTGSWFGWLVLVAWFWLVGFGWLVLIWLGLIWLVLIWLAVTCQSVLLVVLVKLELGWFEFELRLR